MHRVVDPRKKVPDLNCEVRDLLLEVVDLKQEVPDLRSGEIPLNLTPAYFCLHVGLIRVIRWHAARQNGVYRSMQISQLYQKYSQNTR